MRLYTIGLTADCIQNVNKWYFGYSRMLIQLYTVALDTVELASNCIQKLKLKHKLRFKRHTRTDTCENITFPCISYAWGKNALQPKSRMVFFCDEKGLHNPRCLHANIHVVEQETVKLKVLSHQDIHKYFLHKLLMLF